MHQKIKAKARQLGFDLVGITDASRISDRDASYLSRWLADGCAGEMAYMKNNFGKRINPSLLLDGAKSVICTGLSFKQPQNKPPFIAAYACYEDYHYFIKQRLFKLAEFIKTIAVRSCKFKICVDSAPIAERYFAARAGLGFIAKNHMLTNLALGQQILLGEIVTDLELQADTALTTNCDGCDKCIKSCPTGALTEKGFDARLCISYLTIEHKSQIPQELKAKIGEHFFGCDECVNACPYNNLTTEHTELTERTKKFKFRQGLQQIDLQKIMRMHEEEFAKTFAGTAILRLGVARAKRNAAVCINNLNRL